MKRYFGPILIVGIIVVFTSFYWGSSNPPSRHESNLEVHHSPDLLKEVNDQMYMYIKNDPASLYKLNRVIASSEFLKAQKKAFIEKHYRKSSTLSEIQQIRMLDIYMKSQNYSKALQNLSAREGGN